MNSFFKIFDRIFILHLEEDVERKKNIQKVIQKINNIGAIEIFPAITPNNPNFLRDVAEVKKISSFPNCFRCGKETCKKIDCNNIFIPAQIACYLTHSNVLQEIVTRKYKFSLIIEDDVFLHDYAVKLMNSEENTKKIISKLKIDNPQLIKLGWALNSEHKPSSKINIIENDNITMSNPAYSVNLKGATKIVEYLKNNGMTHTVDMMIHFDKVQNLSRCRISPPFFSELSWSTGEINSSIHPKEKHLAHLQSRLTCANESERNSINSQIENIKERLILQQKHCKIIDYAIINIDDTENNLYKIENLLDPLVQSIILGIEPVFIKEATILLSSNFKNIENFYKRLNEIFDKAHMLNNITNFTEIIQKSDDPINILTKISKTKINCIASTVGLNTSTNNTTFTSKISNILNHNNTEKNNINFENNLKELYNTTFNDKTSLYQSYRMYLHYAKKFQNLPFYFPIKPKISIITVTYNAEKCIHPTLQSIFAQEDIEYELILLDGSPGGKTAIFVNELSKNFEKKYCTQQLLLVGKDAGIYDAMNKVIEIARGEYLVFMNAGDKFASNHILSKMYQLSQNCDFIYGNTVVQFKKNEQIIASEVDTSLLPFGNIFSHQSVMIKSSVHKNMLYDTRYSIVGDHNIFLKSYLHGNTFKKIDLEVSIVDPNGVSSNAIERTLERWISVRRIFQKFKFNQNVIDLIDNFYSSLCKETPLPGGTYYYKKYQDKYISIKNEFLKRRDVL